MTSRIILIIAVIFFAGELNAGQVEKEFCIAQWPEDYSMQEYCYNGQMKAKDAYFAIVKKYMPKDSNGVPIPPSKLTLDHMTDEIKILMKCQSEWRQPSGHVDYKMVLYCSEKQLSAYQRMGHK